MPERKRRDPARPGITQGYLEQVRGSKSLQELEFYGSPISSIGYDNIGAIPNLRELYFNQVNVCDDNLACFKNLTNLTKLTLENNSDRVQISDAGLVPLGGMTRLEWLNLTGSRVTGQGLASLKALKKLRRLYLGWTQVDDAGLEVIASFPHLEVMELHQTKITDAGLARLKGLTNLRELSLIYTKVSEKAVDELKEAIPTLTNAR